MTSGLCQGCLVAEVSQRWYAHRSRQNLMVMELNITFYGGSSSALPPLLLLLNNTIGGASPDLNANSLPPPRDIASACADLAPPSPICTLPVSTSITIAETKTPEIQGGGVFTVAWAADTVPLTLEVNSSMLQRSVFRQCLIVTFCACMLLQFVSSYSSSSWNVPDPLAAAVAALRRCCCCCCSTSTSTTALPPRSSLPPSLLLTPLQGAFRPTSSPRRTHRAVGGRVAARQRAGVWQPAFITRHQQQPLLPHVFLLAPSSSVAVSRWSCIEWYQQLTTNTNTKHRCVTNHPQATTATLSGIVSHGCSRLCSLCSPA